MKIINTVPEKQSNNIVKFTLPALFVLLIILYAFLSSSDSRQQVEYSKLWTTQVQQGDLTMAVTGFGALEVKETRFITSPVNAVIESVHAVAGDVVEPGKVLLELSNNDIEQQVSMARLELVKAKFEQDMELSRYQMKLLSDKARLSDLKSQRDLQQLKLTAEAELHKKDIISELDLKQTALALQQLENQIELEQEVLNYSQTHLVTAQQAYNQMIEELNAVHDERIALKDKLLVRATIPGVVQALTIKPGQSIMQGGELVQISGGEAFIARLMIPQREVTRIVPGQEVLLDTYGGSAKGRVSHINTRVIDGKIEIKVNLEGELPGNARAELNVKARIIVGESQDSLYIPQPPGAEANTTHDMYVINEDSDNLIATTVRFGEISGKYIQVLSGLSLNDEVVMSDMSDFADKRTVPVIR